MSGHKFVSALRDVAVLSLVLLGGVAVRAALLWSWIG